MNLGMLEQIYYVRPVNGFPNLASFKDSWKLFSLSKKACNGERGIGIFENMGERETLKTSDYGEKCCNSIVFCNINENSGIVEWDSRSHILSLEVRWINCCDSQKGDVLVSMFLTTGIHSNG